MRTCVPWLFFQTHSPHQRSNTQSNRAFATVSTTSSVCPASKDRKQCPPIAHSSSLLFPQLGPPKEKI